MLWGDVGGDHPPQQAQNPCCGVMGVGEEYFILSVRIKS